MRALAPLAAAALLAGCATTPQGLPPAAVQAVAETRPVGTGNADAADDPAVWRNASDPSASLIVATDKKAGLYVYGLDGKVRSFFDGGLVNNVDLLDMGAAGVIVVASDRNDLANAKLQVLRLDPVAGTLTLLGKVDGGAGEAYGVCLKRDGDTILAYSVLKEGRIHELRITAGAVPAARPLRNFSIPTQTEGCVVDPRDGTLYVGEEDAGIWRFASGADTGEKVVPIDNRMLVADVEGLALLPEGTDGGYLVASSQGDNAYAVFRLPGLEPLGRFRVAPGGSIGGSEETDGIELTGGSFGTAYPEGLFIAQDGFNEPAAQNFKLVSWGDVLRALSTPVQ